MQTLIHVTALSHVSLSFPWPRGDIGGAGGGLLLLGAPPESLRRPCLSHAYCALGPGPEARPVQRVQERDVGAGWWNSPSLRPLLLPCEHPCRQHMLLCWVDRLARHGWTHSLRGFCICHGSYSEVSRPPPLRCHFLREALPDHPTQTVPFTALRAGAELSARRSTCLLSVH